MSLALAPYIANSAASASASVLLFCYPLPILIAYFQSRPFWAVTACDDVEADVRLSNYSIPLQLAHLLLVLIGYSG